MLQNFVLIFAGFFGVPAAKMGARILNVFGLFFLSLTCFLVKDQQVCFRFEYYKETQLAKKINRENRYMYF